MGGGGLEPNTTKSQLAVFSFDPSSTMKIIVVCCCRGKAEEIEGREGVEDTSLGFPNSQI
jgi:hypothetical protein